MRVLIVEDETAAAQNLCSILKSLMPNVEVLDILDTVVDSIEWFSSNASPDLVFMDIHLSDGDSFRIFDSVKVSAPIIFTTAYDQYALKAFEVNSIDYLLKPLNESEVQRALNKWQTLTGSERTKYIKSVDKTVHQQSGENRTFLVRFREKIIPISHKDIAFCYTFNERVSIYGYNGERCPIEHTLESLQGILSDTDFFRANRQFIIARRAIKDISVWIGSRLMLNLTVEVPEKIIISKARVHEFKLWVTSSSAE
ncbi:MAG: response regulator transcription factor [Alistipes sp.]|nr:response regulator transcription factor [Alistipes sp.]